MDQMVGALHRSNIDASVVEDRRAAVEEVLRLLPPEGVVAFAGSQTVRDIGLREGLLKKGDVYTIIDPYEAGISAGEAHERRRRSLLADALLTGSNAVTRDGHLINMDNQGNRVAGIAFGPRKVIIVVGINKIVKNDVEARKRIATMAAPLNSRRLGRGNPCEVTGRCEGCASETRICRIFSIVSGQTIPGRIHVVIVKENLGY